MIAFRPIGIIEYNMNVQLGFKTIPAELIEQGNFKLYFDDLEAHRIAKLECVNNLEWGYTSFVIQYCIDENYLDDLRNTQNQGSKESLIKETVLIPEQDAQGVNEFVIDRAFIVGFYYNKKNRSSKYPIEKNEVRRLQILQEYSQWDPEKLIEMHAPRDEYYNEIHDIWKRVSENTTTAELAGIIKEVTENAFGTNYLKKDTDIFKIAQKIDQYI